VPQRPRDRIEQRLPEFWDHVGALAPAACIGDAPIPSSIRRRAFSSRNGTVAASLGTARDGQMPSVMD
jgi:hypothetical protein